LGFLEFLAFGKAIRAERPILLKRPFEQSKQDASDKLRQPLTSKPKENPPISLVEKMTAGLSEEFGDELDEPLRAEDP
jgi:hypothetical protein